MKRKKILKKIIFLLVFILLPISVFADFQISQYQFYKNIEGEGQGNFYFKIDKDIYKNADIFFRDIRVVDKDNKEQKYFIGKIKDEVKYKRINKDLETVFEKENTFILDRGLEGEYISSIRIKSNSVDFSRVVDVYGSNLKTSRYEKISDKQGSVISVSPVKIDLEINFKYSNYRFIKLVFSGNEGEFKSDGFYITENKQIKKKGEKENLNISFENLNKNSEEKSKKQKILLTIKEDNLPIDSFIIKTKENDFERPISVYASNDKDAFFLGNGTRYDEKKNYWKKKYSGKFTKKIYYNEQIFKIDDNKKYYLLVIENGDNEPLEIREIVGLRYFDFLYLNKLDFSQNSYRVFYGNKNSRKVNYDLTAFKKDLLNEVKISGEKKNELYIPPSKKLGEDKPYLIYIFISFLLLILFWFVYKILREDNSRGDSNADYVDKL